MVFLQSCQQPRRTEQVQVVGQRRFIAGILQLSFDFAEREDLPRIA